MYDISLFTLNKSNSLKKKEKTIPTSLDIIRKWKNANKYRSQVTLIKLLSSTPSNPFKLLSLLSIITKYPNSRGRIRGKEEYDLSLSSPSPITLSSLVLLVKKKTKEIRIKTYVNIIGGRWVARRVVWSV